MMKALFVGLGSVGQRHLRNLRTLGSFEYIALRSRGLALPAEFDDLSIRVVRGIDEAIAEQPDLALLCAPAVTQQAVLGPLVRETRCHLFIEKPITPSLDNLAEYVCLLERQRRKSLIGYNLRFHPVVAVVQQALQSKALGRVCSARASVGQYLPDWHPAEDYRQGYSANRRLGGGVLLDLIHELDLMYSWFGKPTAVKAIASKVSSLSIDTEDTAEVVCRFADGVVGSIHLDYVQRVPFRNGSIVGEAASLTYDLLKNECAIYRPGTEPEVHSFPDFVRNDMYSSEISRLLEAIATDVPCTPSLREGVEVLEFALAAKQDAGLG